MDTNECANVQMNQRAKVLEWIDGRRGARTDACHCCAASSCQACSVIPSPSPSPIPIPGRGLPLRPGLRLTRGPRARALSLPRCFSLRGILVRPPSHFPGAAHRARADSHNVRAHLITTPKSMHTRRTRLRTTLLAFSRREAENVAAACRVRPRHVVCHMHVCRLRASCCRGCSCSPCSE